MSKELMFTDITIFAAGHFSRASPTPREAARVAADITSERSRGASAILPSPCHQLAAARTIDMMPPSRRHMQYAAARELEPHFPDRRYRACQAKRLFDGAAA